MSSPTSKPPGLTSINKLSDAVVVYYNYRSTSTNQTNHNLKFASQLISKFTTMTPFFLNGKSPRAMQRELLTNDYHGREHYQQDTSIQSTSTGLGRRTRIVHPSPFGSTQGPSSYERLPSWFTSRGSIYPYIPKRLSTSMSAAEIAHRSVTYDLYNSHFSIHPLGSERYSNRYTTYYPDRQPEYPLVQKRKKKKKVDDAHVQQKRDELVFVRTRGNRVEDRGWRKTEKEVEWLRGRRWM